MNSGNPNGREGGSLPRRLAEGVYWLGDCLVSTYGERVVHAYHSVFVVHGTDASIVVDTGPPKDWGAIARQLDRLEEAGIPPVRYLFPTHPEVPHAGNLAELLTRYPDAVATGDCRDYQLIYPDKIDRFSPLEIDESVDLGQRHFARVPAVVKDLVSTQWGYDKQKHVLFPGDGFAYMHHHGVEECGKTAEEMPDLPLPEFMAIFQEYALYWTRFTDMTQCVEELRAFLRKYPSKIIAPGHGAPITRPEVTMTRVEEGLLLSGVSPREGAPAGRNHDQL